MFASNALVVPDRGTHSESSVFTLAKPSSTSTVIFECFSKESYPIGPSILIKFSLIINLIFSGIAIGLLAILDIFYTYETIQIISPP